MEQANTLMKRFEFLIGDWTLEYKIPASKYSEAMTGTGSGTISRQMDNKYVVFDYRAQVGDSPEVQAHAIFVWDSKLGMYRFWWFESSGNFNSAVCRFINDETLIINWQDSLLIQTFQKTGPNTVLLKMKDPDADGNYVPVMEVLLTRK